MSGLQRHQGGWAIAASLFLALLLAAAPMPDWAGNWRPEWVAMVLIYWCMAMPSRVGIWTGWMLGLVLDVLQGGLLGQHSIGLALVAFITLSLHQRLRVSPLLQQALAVALMLVLYRLLWLWIGVVTGQQAAQVMVWLPALSSMLLWPWLFILLRDLRRRASVR